MRSEGLDLALLAGNLTNTPTGEVVAHAPTATSEKLFTQREFGYFVLISLLYAGLIALFVLATPTISDLFNP